MGSCPRGTWHCWGLCGAESGSSVGRPSCLMPCHAMPSRPIPCSLALGPAGTPSGTPASKPSGTGLEQGATELG